jgi:hypothetical protein
MAYARIAANEEEPATPAQVRQLARALSASCSAPQYASIRVLHGLLATPEIQRCVAVVTKTGKLVMSDCPGDDGPASITRPGMSNRQGTSDEAPNHGALATYP